LFLCKTSTTVQLNYKAPNIRIHSQTGSPDFALPATSADWERSRTNPYGQPSHMQKLFTERSKGQKFRKSGGNLPRKYLQCCIYIVTCPVMCMKENAVRVVIDFNNCILQFSPSGLKKILNRLLNLY